jgi:protein-tyrosine phosphatase
MCKFSFGSTALLVALSFATATAQQPINTPLLPSDENFRDVAGLAKAYSGTGFADTTSHNGVMRTGIFYRSQSLNNLTPNDWTTLSSLGIRHDIDLRTPAEINGNTDWVPQDATYTNVNIYGTPTPPPVNIVTDADRAKLYMIGSYEGFVADPLQRQQFRTLLTDLAHASSPTLYHCSAGKDRTGWTSMLLQSMAGVSQANIHQAYMATNDYMANGIKSQETQLNNLGLGYMWPILVVDPAYLQAGLDEVTQMYGSIDAYLKQGIGLTQADIYVLRAKMVYYQTVPGQGQFSGNAAAGARLLAELQNSPLSGSYTAYNYYFQSAIDAGSLGDVPSQVGGQVHADATAYLLRQPLWVDWAIAPYASGSDLGVCQRRFWVAGLGDYFASSGHGGLATSTEYNGGTLVGITCRLADPLSAYCAVGDNAGTVASAGANADVNTGLFTFGARYGLFGLEAGPFVAARADIGWIDYTSNRALDGGLGTAHGHSAGGLYSGRADVGDVLRLASFTLTPQVGFRLTNASLAGFHENGSDMALGVDGFNRTMPSFLADLNVSLDPTVWRGWVVAPFADLGYELALDSPQVEGGGQLYGFGISQVSAYDSWYLMKAGLGITAQRDAFVLTFGVNGIFAERSSSGLIPQLSVGYRF